MVLVMQLLSTAGDMSFSYSVQNEQTNAIGATAALEEEEMMQYKLLTQWVV